MAALLVVEAHSFFYNEQANNPALPAAFHFGFLGLPVFFFISGLLVTQSLFKSSSLKNFAWKRVLRIYPAACLSILFCAIIIGPLFTRFSISDYFSDASLYRFLGSCTLVHIHFFLPGVFEHSVMGTSSVISPFWSVALEIKLYFGLLIAWAIKIPGRRYLLIVLIFLLIISGYFFPDAIESFVAKISGLYINFYLYATYMPLFLIGVLCAIYKKKIFIRNYWIFIMLPLLLLSIYVGAYSMVSFVLLPAIVLYIAANGTKAVKWITPNADLSYGIYVFAFPVQQVIANYLHPANPAIMFLLSVVFVLPLAWASWHFVEKNALKGKGLVK